MKTRSAVSYFGSDSEVAEEIAILLRGCTHVTIRSVVGCQSCRICRREQ